MERHKRDTTIECNRDPGLNAGPLSDVIEVIGIIRMGSVVVMYELVLVLGKYTLKY